jgi:hypothetical protein
VPDVPEQPKGSLSSLSESDPTASPPFSDDKRSELVEALIINTRAQLALVEAIRELIEYGTSQQQDPEEEYLGQTLDTPPIRRS